MPPNKLQLLCEAELPGKPFTSENWKAHQLDRLRQTLRYAAMNSRFYAARLPGGNALFLESFEDLERFPFTGPEDIVASLEEFLCIPPSEVHRIVTLFTSGSTGDPKRVGFSRFDVERTVGFFCTGMQEITKPGMTAMICLPGTREFGVVDLLSRGIEEFGGYPHAYGPIIDLADAAAFIRDHRPYCVVAIPGQMLALAGYMQNQGLIGEVTVETMLLTADFVADSAKRRVEAAFGCKVYNHYGSTEMGYGGALECSVRSGLHLRENDHYFEVVNPATGKHVAPGEEGEIVFTTLTREAMPLIRYRTGDFARYLLEQCGCGGILPRISTPRRISGCEIAVAGGVISLHRLDEAMFSQEEVVDYQAVFRQKSKTLEMVVWPKAGTDVDKMEISPYLLPHLPKEVTLKIGIAQPGQISPCLLGKRILSVV